MVKFIMRVALRISVCLGLLACGFVDAPFLTDDVNAIRSLADKFTLTSAQETQFLTKAQGLVSNFSGATNDQKNFVIQAIQDGRYGGTMPNIQAQLDTLIATAKATPAGVASAPGTTPAVGYSATGQTGSAAGGVVTPGQTYVERIAALQASLNGFRYQQVTESDKASVFAIIQGIYADRGDSFSDERQSLIQVLSNAEVLLYRGDAAIKSQIDTMITSLGSIVSFDVQLAYQKQLYTNFNPLTDTQKARILKHFQEMTDMAQTLTDVTMYNDFRDLLQFVDVRFFQDDAASHAQMTRFLSRVREKDPVFSQPFGTIISTLQAAAPTTASADIPTFITKVQTLVTMRYGTQVGDDVNKVANSTALQNFLSALIALPPFSSSVPQLTVWLGMVKSDNISPTSINFGDRIAVYATPDFMTTTYDPTKRATFLTDLAKLMNDRYGASANDLVPATYTANKAKLRQLLAWMTQISWFSDSLTTINGYIATVDADSNTPPAPGTVLPTPSGQGITNSVTPTGVFNVSFGSDISTQLTQLEQSLNAISSDNNRELFILSLYDVVGRKSSATTVDVGRMRTLATNAQTNTLLGSTYVGFCNFILGGVNGSFDVALRNQLYVDFLTRISNMTNVVDQVQDAFLNFALTLVNAARTLAQAQVNALSAALQSVASRTTFTAARINDVRDLSTALTNNLSGTTQSSAGNTTITTDATGATVLSGTPAITSTTPTQNPAINSVTTQSQQAAARALLNARANAWR